MRISRGQGTIGCVRSLARETRGSTPISSTTCGATSEPVRRSSRPIANAAHRRSWSTLRAATYGRDATSLSTQQRLSRTRFCKVRGIEDERLYRLHNSESAQELVVVRVTTMANIRVRSLRRWTVRLSLAAACLSLSAPQLRAQDLVEDIYFPFSSN